MIRQFTVDTPTRALSGATNAYIVGDEDGLLVDPGGRSVELDEAVSNRAAHVAVTHLHPDHVGAVAAYAQEFDLTVWCLAGREDPFTAATDWPPDQQFTPGETIPVAGGIEIMDTPGHAPGHISFGVGDTLLCGDLAIASGSLVVGAPEGDMRAYITSLRRVHARNPSRLYPGHGPVIDSPRETCARLIRHRLDREQSVLRAVEAGNQTVDSIVDGAYEKDISAVYDLARATVIAHLEKLAVEGAVRWDGERARSG